MTANGEVNVKERRSDSKHRDAEGDDAIVNVNTITVQGDFLRQSNTRWGFYVIHTVHIITINTAAKKDAH
jgi:hypothetical protein